jgi:hypothetical protein
MIDLNKNPNAPFEKFDNKTPQLNLQSNHPTPVLIVYLDVREIPNDIFNETINETYESLSFLKNHGWLHIVCPVRETTRIECLSTDKADYIEFEKFKTKILAKCTN